MPVQRVYAPGISSYVGQSTDSIPTPALIVELPALLGNLDKMARMASQKGVRIRPHGKAHKCPEIAALQLARGASGICCQTVSEAERFASAGIPDILLTNQVSNAAQAKRLGTLARVATIGVCVDSERQVSLLDDAAKDAGVVMRVYIELDVGGARCGLIAASDVLSLARAICRCDGLKFAGLQAYNGKAQHIRDWTSRNAMVRESARQTQTAVSLLKTAGIDCESITGGGSGSFEADVDVGVLSELQCGTYALMDADYMSVRRKDGSFLDSMFSSALFVLSSIVSDRHPDYVVSDAGLKAMAFDSGMPRIATDPNLVYGNPSDEHGVIVSQMDAPLPRWGDRVALVPGHCDPTMAMHDRIYVTVEGMVKAVWPTISGGSW